MSNNMNIEVVDRIPIYKQLIEHFETEIIGGRLKPGDAVPSMNELASQLEISKETVKKAYGILCQRGLLEARQGKGFFVASRTKSSRLRILILVDSLSPYRQAFINAFSEKMGRKAEIAFFLHNQDVDLLRFFLDKSLGKYDYYIVTPHFSGNEQIHTEAIKQLSRIPNRQLILADNWDRDLQGNYGAVYQDYEHDAVDSLKGALPEIRMYPCFDVFRMSNSLYGGIIQDSIGKFCKKNGIKVRFHKNISPDDIHDCQLCLFLNSQADQMLFTINEIAEQKKLRIGKDIKVISYNETPICELVLGGLSTISSDFAEMGRLCAEMIKEGNMSKIKCPFRMIRRKTF